MILTEQQLKNLEAYLADLPFRYANPIFVFLNDVKLENEKLKKDELQGGNKAKTNSE